ncbi:MAG: Gfo/Idh/MocA family oxidoreductase [Lachnospiraceae bacterium]|nr:Gfo/Idh/MocA family oxidoreductase [Lachnospiraceae bacterium]
MRFNVAILGAGNIAEAMAKALKGLGEEVSMYAVASRTLDKAAAFAKKWGFQKAYGSYEELADDEAVDLIYVATPHSEHFKNAKLCIERGRNCLVEKAFCANKKQAEEIISLAKEKKALLAEAMWTRYQPSKEVIKDCLGDLGKIHYLESDFSVPIIGVDRLYNPSLAGGALLDLGIYSLTVPAMYLGTDIKKVQVSTVKTDTGVDATDVIMLTYQDGTMARAKCSCVDDHSNYAKIVGDKGTMVFGPINAPEKVCIYDVEGNLIKKIDTPYRVNGYEYEVLACKEALQNGQTEAKDMPHSETLRMMGWMDAIRNHVGIVYPFENAADIALDDKDVWGVENAFCDENITV